MYKHRIVQALHDLVENFAGKGSDPMIKALWLGLKPQVPFILNTLDNNEELIAIIEAKVREALGIEPVQVGVKELEIKATPPQEETKDKKPKK